MMLAKCLFDGLLKEKFNFVGAKMTIKPCAVALLGLLLLACSSDGSNHESGHELNPQPGSYVCNTPGDADLPADVTICLLYTSRCV